MYCILYSLFEKVASPITDNKREIPEILRIIEIMLFSPVAGNCFPSLLTVAKNTCWPLPASVLFSWLASIIDEAFSILSLLIESLIVETCLLWLTNLTGFTWETGLAGLTGLIDATGLVGLAGLTDATGLAGLTGLIVTTGLVGLAGLIVTTGLVGLAGLTDATGLAGLTGLTGATG